MVVRHVVARLDDEAPLGRLLERREPRAPGPIRMLATCALTSTRNDLVARALARSERSRCSRSTAAVCSETTMPSPAQTGHFLREDLARPVGDVLARHLDEAERRDLDDVGLRAVALELLAQRLLDVGAVLRVRHVDEVDDDDPADVAQPQLAHDLLDRLDVVLRDRVLERWRRRLRARADEAARVDVDDGERLGVVEDEVAAGGQVDPPRERRLDLRVDTELLEQRQSSTGGA